MRVMPGTAKQFMSVCIGLRCKTIFGMFTTARIVLTNSVVFFYTKLYILLPLLYNNYNLK